MPKNGPASSMSGRNHKYGKCIMKKNNSPYTILCSILLFVIFFISYSCTTMKTYEGSELSNNQIALITQSSPFNPFGQAIFIEQIDSRDLTGNMASTSYTILPGKHVLTVNCQPYYAVGTYRPWIKKSINFEAKAGRQYKFAHSRNCEQILIMDTETKEVVGGDR